MCFSNPAILLVKKLTTVIFMMKVELISTFRQVICESFSSNKNASTKNIFTLRMCRRDFIIIMVIIKIVNWLYECDDQTIVLLFWLNNRHIRSYAFLVGPRRQYNVILTCWRRFNVCSNVMYRLRLSEIFLWFYLSIAFQDARQTTVEESKKWHHLQWKC